MEKAKIDTSVINSIRAELQSLDDEIIQIDGNRLKASQCYRFELDPMHVMFNTNCPDHLRERVNSILSKYIHSNESGA